MTITAPEPTTTLLTREDLPVGSKVRIIANRSSHTLDIDSEHEVHSLTSRTPTSDEPHDFEVRLASPTGRSYGVYASEVEPVGTTPTATPTTFEDGKTYRITGNTNSHCFDIGEVVRAYDLRVQGDGTTLARGERLDGSRPSSNNVRFRDVVLVEDAPAAPVGPVALADMVAGARFRVVNTDGGHMLPVGTEITITADYWQPLGGGSAHVAGATTLSDGGSKAMNPRSTAAGASQIDWQPGVTGWVKPENLAHLTAPGVDDGVIRVGDTIRITDGACCSDPGDEVVVIEVQESGTRFKFQGRKAGAYPHCTRRIDQVEKVSAGAPAPAAAPVETPWKPVVGELAEIVDQKSVGGTELSAARKALFPLGTQVKVISIDPYDGEVLVQKVGDSTRRTYLGTPSLGQPLTAEEKLAKALADLDASRQELADYRTFVRSKVIGESKAQGWCSRTDSWLKELGLDPRVTAAFPNAVGSVILLDNGSLVKRTVDYSDPTTSTWSVIDLTTGSTAAYPAFSDVDVQDKLKAIVTDTRPAS